MRRDCSNQCQTTQWRPAGLRPGARRRWLGPSGEGERLLQLRVALGLPAGGEQLLGGTETGSASSGGRCASRPRRRRASGHASGSRSAPTRPAHRRPRYGSCPERTYRRPAGGGIPSIPLSQVPQHPGPFREARADDLHQRQVQPRTVHIPHKVGVHGGRIQPLVRVTHLDPLRPHHHMGGRQHRPPAHNTARPLPVPRRGRLAPVGDHLHQPGRQRHRFHPTTS
jgi:hypothetical protein